MQKRMTRRLGIRRRNTIILGCLWILALSLSACSDDGARSGDKDASGGEVDVEEAGEDGQTHDDANSDVNAEVPRVLASPNPLTFESVDLGESAIVSVTISNAGDSTLRISKITLREDTGGSQLDMNEEFFREGDGWGHQDLRLEPGMTHRVQVRYSPVNHSPDTGSILIESNDPADPQYIIPIDTQGLTAEIFSLPTFSFGRVVPPSDAQPGWRGEWKLMPVSNVGGAPLRISEISIRDHATSRFDFSIPDPTARTEDGLIPGPEYDTQQWPDSLEPNESFNVRVWFAPDTTNPKEGELVFTSNDPARPEHSVTLLGNTGAPCIEVSPFGQVDFGLSSLGNISQQTVTVTNCSPNSKLELRNIAVVEDGGGVFALEDGSLPAGLPDEDFILDEGDRTDFVVTFRPTAESAYSGGLEIRSNDPSQTVITMPLNGQGTP